MGVVGVELLVADVSVTDVSEINDALRRNPRDGLDRLAKIESHVHAEVVLSVRLHVVAVDLQRVERDRLDDRVVLGEVIGRHPIELRERTSALDRRAVEVVDGLESFGGVHDSMLSTGLSVVNMAQSFRIESVALQRRSSALQ